MHIAVYLGSNDGDSEIFTNTTKQLGSWIGENHHTLVYGGAKWGLMGLLAQNTLEHGGNAIGVIPTFIADRGVAFEGLTQLITVDTMSLRKQKMIDLSDAYIAMPGGPGTLEEIIEVISLSRLNRHQKPCILMNLNSYYNDLEALFNTMIKHGFVKKEELKHTYFVHSLDECIEILNKYL